MSKQPVDALARERALCPDHSFICVAPAGSGKTELLTQRMLVLLARVQQPEEILAITFTRKAAAEMQHRVLGALRLAQGPKPAEPHKQHTWSLAKAALQADAQNGWQLLQSPHRLQVRTFDGLCASLVKALPLQSQMGAGVALSDDPDRLFTLAANNVMAELESGGEPAEALAQLLMHLDNQQQRVAELLVALLKTRAAWLPLIMAGDGRVREHLEACLQNIREAHIERLQDLFDEQAASRLLALAVFAARNLPADSSSPIRNCEHISELPDASEQGLAQWQGLAALLLSGTGGWRKRLTKNEGFPTKAEGVKPAELKALKADLGELITAFSANETLRESLFEVALLPYTEYPEQQWQILQSLTVLLPRLVAHLQLVFAGEGQLDFTEISLRADRALGSEDEPTDLALRLDHRISHVLVDEFQDTSSNQMQLVQKLTAGWQGDDGRTLFCVGDAMQSIYAFRSANVGLFLRCLGSAEEGGSLGALTLELLKLNTNFRSDGGVVTWINTAFSQAFPKHIDLNLGAVPFSEAVAFNADVGPAVCVQGFVGDGAKCAEGEWLAAQIQQVLAADAQATIAILGRGRRQLHNVLPALKSAGIRYRAVDLDPLAAVPAVQDAWVLTRALINTSDTIAWLSILRAPWCGLRLNALLALRAQPGVNVLAQVNELLKGIEKNPNIVDQDSISRLTLIFDVLSSSLAQRARKPLAEWVKGAWLALGGAAALTLEQQNNVERFFDALAECDEAQLIQHPERLEKLLTELYALPDPEAGSQVQVMTMHKSKGLEFDAVFLVGLAAASGVPDTPLMRWHEQLFEYQYVGDGAASTWLLSPVGERGQDKDALYQWLGYQQKKREHLEACRLLYVACTRAKKQLYLSAVLKQKEGADITAPSSGSLLAHIWPSVASSFALHCLRTDTAEPIDNVDGAAVANLHRLAPAQIEHQRLQLVAKVRDFQPVLDPSPLGELSLLTLSDNDEQKAEGFARAVGSLVHEVLELMVPAVCVQAERPPATPNWQDFFAAWRVRLGQLLVAQPDAVLNALCEKTAAQLNKVFSEASPLWQALRGAQEVHTEFAISGADAEGAAQHWRIDLWWREADGAVVLLDYKSAIYSAGSQQDFEREQLEHYRADLLRYGQLLASLLAEPVTPILYLTDSHSWLKLPVVQPE